MTTTKGPNGPVILKVRVPTRGHRTGTQTTASGVDAVIDKLDSRGHWGWLRAAALWQNPAMLSEDEQLAVVLNELADPDHPEHSGTSVNHEHARGRRRPASQRRECKARTVDRAKLEVLEPPSGTRP